MIVISSKLKLCPLKTYANNVNVKTMYNADWKKEPCSSSISFVCLFVCLFVFVLFFFSRMNIVLLMNEEFLVNILLPWGSCLLLREETKTKTKKRIRQF